MPEEETIAPLEGVNIPEVEKVGVSDPDAVKVAGPDEDVDIFAWSNNLVQYVEELKVELYFFSKNSTVYRVKTGGESGKQRA